MSAQQKTPADFAASLTRRFKNILSGVKRFPHPVSFGFLIFINTAVFVLRQNYIADDGTLVYRSSTIPLQALLASALCFFATSAVNLAALRFSLPKKISDFSASAAALLWIPFFFLTKNFNDTPAPNTFYAFWGLSFALFALCIFLCISESNKKVIFPHIFASFFFAEVTAFAVFAGLILCGFAFNTLIFSINLDEYFIISFTFSQSVVAVTVFLSLLQLDEKNITVPRSFRAIVLYALFPLYALLMLILYAYLLKILIQQKMPSGQINPFVSFASFFYIAFYFLLQSRENRAVSLFYKIANPALIPCIIAQIIAVAIRFQAYGLTSARLAGMLYIASVLYFIVLTFIKDGKYTPTFFILIAALCLVSTLTPLHIKRIPDLEQHRRLEKLLHSYGYYTDGVFAVPAAAVIDKIPDEKKEAIKSAYYALPHEMQKEYAPHKKNFKEKFGFQTPSPSDSGYKTFEYIARNTKIDISSYSSLERLYEYSGVECEKVIHVLDEKKYNLTDFMLNMPNNDEPFVIPAGDARLYILEANCQYDEDTQNFRFYRYSGYIFR
ncbi:DUF4153 domain-containing protein [Treponema sp. HNW]|uniref:DUF4153 domain-containing protein n=1 Tax=Treponema sp. HNW TaxID=3116654 RepID=UPI003D0CA35F